jgi:hypothetical protein
MAQVTIICVADGTPTIYAKPIEWKFVVNLGNQTSNSKATLLGEPTYMININLIVCA